MLHSALAAALLLPLAFGCQDIFVRWSRVKYGHGARVTGSYSRKDCQEACAKDQHPSRTFQGYSSVPCAGFNHRQGQNSLMHDCQIFDAAQLEFLDSQAMADDRYSFYRKLCVPAAKTCHSHYHFAFVPDQYMDLSTAVSKVLPDVSLEQCLGLCLDGTEASLPFTCRSAGFNRTSSTCFLSSQSAETAPLSVRRNHDPNFRVDYYQSNCFSNAYAFSHKCTEEGFEVSVDSRLAYTGVMYGLYDYFSCRVEPVAKKRFSFLFPFPERRSMCRDSISRRRGGRDYVLEVVLSTDSVEPAYYLTADDLTYQATCPVPERTSQGSPPPDASLISASVQFRPSQDNSAPNKTVGVLPVLPRIDAEAVTRPREAEEGSRISVMVALPDKAKPAKATAPTSTTPRATTPSTTTARITSTLSSTTPSRAPTRPSTKVTNTTAEQTTQASPTEAPATPPVHWDPLTKDDLLTTRFRQLYLANITSLPTTKVTAKYTVLPSTFTPTRQTTTRPTTTAPATTKTRLSTTTSRSETSTSTTQLPPTTLGVRRRTRIMDRLIASGIIQITRTKRPGDKADRRASTTRTSATKRPTTPSTTASTSSGTPSSTTAVPSTVSTVSSSTSSSSVPTSTITDTTTTPTSTTTSARLVTGKTTSAGTRLRITSPRVSSTTVQNSTRPKAPTPNMDRFWRTKPTSTTQRPSTPAPTSSTTTTTARPTTTATSRAAPPSSTGAGASGSGEELDPVLFDIFFGGRPVEAVVVGSRVTLSLTPLVAVPRERLSVVGCQVEPVGDADKVLLWEREEPLVLLSDGCPADQVGLVCPPQASDFGLRIRTEAFRYQSTSQIQYTCLVRVCAFGPCPQRDCEAVDGCPLGRSRRQAFVQSGGARTGGASATRNARLDSLAALFGSPALPSPIGASSSAFPAGQGSGQSELSPETAANVRRMAGDHVVKKSFVIVNDENELAYFIRTGKVPRKATPAPVNRFLRPRPPPQQPGAAFPGRLPSGLSQSSLSQLFQGLQGFG